MHCFSGGAEAAEELIKLNFFISFAGNITYPGAGKLREAAESIPADRILIETDSPFLAPQPVRGKRNEPSFLVHTASELAKIRNEDLNEIIRAAGENAGRIFPAVKNGGRVI
jgi:TatD DNase family protein